jgi:ATP-dependent Clp protease ATP-binding subunit ClpA
MLAVSKGVQCVRSSRAAPCGNHAVVRTSVHSHARVQHLRIPVEKRDRSVMMMSASMPSDADTGLPEFGPESKSIMKYAIKFASVSETYTVHPWTLLLGLLRQEDSTACKVLKELGLTDIYGAWHEVLWALNVCDALKPRGYTYEITFVDLTFRTVDGAGKFAIWRESETADSEDMLMALTAAGVLDSLFPDLNLNFQRVRKTIESMTSCSYTLPIDDELSNMSPDDMFL